MKVQTVNVIEYIGDSVSGIESFSDDIEGNKEAEANFTVKAKENGALDNEIEVYNEIEVFLEDGYYETGDYQLFITHSA